MLKNAITCLLAGCLLLLAGLYLAYRPPVSGGAGVPRELPASTARALAGGGEYRDGAFQLRLDSAGDGILMLPVRGVRLDQHPYLRIDFREWVAADSLVLMWQPLFPGREIERWTLPYLGGKTLRLNTGAQETWSGSAASLALYVAGEPGALVSLERMTLETPSFARYLEYAFYNWVAYRPWTGSSVNFQAGVAKAGALPYPVPTLAALFLLGALSYALLLKLPGAPRRFDLRVIALLFLACWLSLDLAWQSNLLRQLTLTHERFAGKSLDEKRRSDWDRALYSFTREVIPLVDTPDARVFVGSVEEYSAMRGAYYLYPLNVFWERHAPELPPARYIHRGDYLMLLNPTQLHIDEQRGALVLPDGSPLSVEVLLSGSEGRLLRVL